MRRHLVAFCPDLALELGAPSAEPLAVVIARPGSAVQAETDLLGQTRIDRICAAAYRFGVRPGDTLAVARAKISTLHVRVLKQAVLEAALAGMAEMALLFGPYTAFDLEKQTVQIDISGCAHLFGGEQALAERFFASAAQMGHVVQLAIADGLAVAEAVACFGAQEEMIAIVPPGGHRQALAPLGLEALPVEPRTRAWLYRLGMRQLSDLTQLPRPGLARRLGAESRALALLDGVDRAPITPYRPPTVIEESAEFADGIDSVEALLFVLKNLCDRVALRLAGRRRAASRLLLSLALDRAYLAPDLAALAELELSFPVPLYEAADLLRALKVRLENYELPAPAPKIRLSVPELCERRAKQLQLFCRESTSEAMLPRLVAELAIDLGPSRVGLLTLADTWVPAERTKLMPFVLGRASDPARLFGVHPEPNRILPAPVLLPSAALPEERRFLFRLEAIDWWRGDHPRADHFAVWIEGGWAWVERTADRASILGWMD